MKIRQFIIVLPLLVAAGTGNAWADRGHGHGHGHGHVRFGVMIGPYWGAPWHHYPPPVFYYPPYYPSVVVQPQAPQVYIEQPQTPAAPATPPAPVAATPLNYWYYCAAARGYYPYVGECPGGWQKVLPQPPGQP